MKKLGLIPLLMLLLSCGSDKTPTAPDTPATRTYNVAALRLPCMRYAADIYCQDRDWAKAASWTCYYITANGSTSIYMNKCTCTE